MKLLIALALLSTTAFADEMTTGQKMKNGVNKAADAVDAGTRKVISKSKDAYHKNKAENDVHEAEAKRKAEAEAGKPLP